MVDHTPAPWVFLDLETTGLKPDRDKIIEVGLIRWCGAERYAWAHLVNPEMSLDPFISQLTGIKEDDLKEAPRIDGIKNDLVKMLQGAMVVAHSAAFDVGFLGNQLDVRPAPDQVIDTIELTKILYPRLHSYSLRSLVRQFGLPVLPGHRALADAEALEALFLFLTAKAMTLPPALLEKIITAFGGEDKGIERFFTAVFLGRLPSWLTQAARAASLATSRSIGEGLETGPAAARPGVVGFGCELSGQPGSEQGREELAGQGSLWQDKTMVSQAKAVQQEERKKAEGLWQDGLAQILAQGGPLARHKEDFQYRPQQVEMLQAVRRAFASSRYLVVEAPTGVGKSLSYLIPALTWALAKGEQVVVATHTIALQEQLYRKEIQLLHQLLPFTFRCALLKGRGNYLCLHRYDQVLQQGKNLVWGERILLARLALWLEEGADGDLDTVHLLGPEREWFAQMASSRETCQGSQCRYFKECFYQKARQQAAGAQLIIVNHALLLAGSRLGEGVLPKTAYLIIDEAHHLEEEGTRQFTDAFSLLEFEKNLQYLHKRRDVFGRPGFLQYLTEFRQQGVASLVSIEPALAALEKQVKQVMKKINSLQGILQNSSLPELFRIKPGSARGQHLTGLLTELDNLRLQSEGLGDILRPLNERLEGEEGKVFEETWLRLQLQVIAQVLQDIGLLQRFLQEVFTALPLTAGLAQDEAGGGAQAGAGEQVYWVRRETRQNDISLCITPLNIAACFQEYVFQEKECVVLTSATLSVKGGFAYFSEQLGIDPDILDTKVLPSPFDFKRQVLLLTDKDLPDPARTAESAYNLALTQSLEILLATCGGQSMVLFTSHRQLRAMYDALNQPLQMLGLELFADGINGSRTTMLDELRRNEKAVVFGANTFWEGVDLPGLALTSLIIVRLPFSPPGQPLVEARIEKLMAEGKDPFYTYSLPQAVLRFKQGYGRLIRTAKDWGVVVVLDNRIVNKRYGQVFLRSLPDDTCFSAGPKTLADRIKIWQKQFIGEA